ncbi:LysR family transcriptional regulator [Amycolatopsis ultiminotia]|uniref:LysR family transcriptional regulator n=1 Tax=Amycolatopsis ultiminotia TaxID=543629 RepID=A0ABP6V2F7_9PSEU
MAPPPIETVDLQVFAAAARLGSFAAAAADLQLSGPSVSTRLAALERRLGISLFERGARGSVLTSAGEQFADYARRCLRLLDEAVADLGTEHSQRLVLAAPASLGSSVFPPALSVLAERPIAVHCQVAHSDEVLRHLRDGTAHAGFLLANPPDGDVRSVRIGKSGIVAVCHPGHRLAGRTRLRFDDLTDSSVLVYRWGPAAESLATVFEHPRRPADRPVHTIGLPMTAVHLAATNGYVAVVPRFAAAALLHNGQLRALPLPLRDWTVDIRFVHSAHASQRPGVTALLEGMPLIRQALAMHPAATSARAQDR